MQRFCLYGILLIILAWVFHADHGIHSDYPHEFIGIYGKKPDMALYRKPEGNLGGGRSVRCYAGKKGDACPEEKGEVAEMD